MRRVCQPFCSCTALRLLCRLSREEPCWEMASLAFLVEVLGCLDLNEWGNNILEILTKHLLSESMEMRRLALRGLVMLSKDPSMAKKMCSLSEPLIDFLSNEDIEVVKMSLSVFTNILMNKDILTSCPTAPKLAAALRPLFDSDNNQVQWLSIGLYKDVMESVVERGKKALKPHVCESLLPLFFHCYDENRRVAQGAQLSAQPLAPDGLQPPPGLGTEMRLLCPGPRCHLWLSAALQTSRETLLSAVNFLKRRDLKQLLKLDDPWSFAEHVVRTGWNPQANPWRSRLPRAPSLWGWRLWPLPSAAGRATSLRPTRRSLPWAVRALLRAPLAPRPVPSSRASALGGQGGPPWQELSGPLLSGAFLTLAMALFLSALQALNSDESPSNTNLIVQVMLDERATSLSSFSGSGQPGQQQMPCRRKQAGDQKGAAGAPGPANAGKI
ncbi:hypothetical protein EK904_002392 [Melospiza melodia maxima]|nr:hypothetical protein EK904_002392 [Melospiza melodia maxima]